MNMQKTGIFLLILLICPLTAAVYGILHDQLTYTISPEYYTKFKFIFFDISPEWQNRAGVCMVGAAATWWTGIPIGLAMGLMGLIHFDAKNMWRFSVQAIGIVLLTALVTGLAGLAYGELVLAHQPVENFSGWYIPEGLADQKNYIAVGSMHNASYLGGAIGLVTGSWWQVRQKRRMKKGR